MLAIFCVSIHTPLTLTLNILSHFSMGNFRVGAPQVAPASFTRISTRGKFSLTTFNILSMSSSLLTSHRMGRALTPNSSAISLAVASSLSIFLEVIMIFAPASARPVAINFPIPLPPPVISAVLPSNLNRSCSFIFPSCCLLYRGRVHFECSSVRCIFQKYFVFVNNHLRQD